MNEPVEHQLSQALLERLEPLIITVESQLRDLAQGQAILHDNVAQLSSDLDLTQAELDKVHDTFARLPHYVAKLTAMRNTIASATLLSKRLKRRADQVAVGREKQAAKMQVARAKEQAYDQAVAAVRAPSSASDPPPQQSAGRSSGSMSPVPPLAQNQTKDLPRTPTQTSSSGILSPFTAAAAASTARGGTPPSPKSQPSLPMPLVRLPFPLPAKPAFPVISTMRSSSRSGSPPLSLSPSMSPVLSGKSSDRDMTASPVSITGGTGSSSEASGQAQERVERFPQTSFAPEDALAAEMARSLSAEVEVVRLRRKKKPASKSSSSSIASISTTSTRRSQGATAKSIRSVLGSQQDQAQDQAPDQAEAHQQ